MNPTLRYHILGRTYKKKYVTKGGAAHKKDYDDVDMTENIISNIGKMKIEDRKVSGGGRKKISTQKKMPLQFKFTI